MRIEGLVDAVQMLGQREVQRGARRRIIGALGGFRVEHHDAQRLTQVGAGHHAGLDRLVHHQLVFDRRRRHIFAFAGLEQVLDAAGDAEKTLCVDLPLVTGVQPAVAGQGLARQLRRLVITQHQRRTAHLDLTGLGVDAGVDPFIARAHRALLVQARHRQVRDGQVLGQAVALVDRQA